MNAYPFPKGWRSETNINCDIKHFTKNTSDQFSLSMRCELIMQATQHAFTRLGVIILYECNGIPHGLFKFVVIETFKEKTTGITKHFGFDEHDFGDGEASGFHRNMYFL